jgi:hypothetical protein
MTTCIDRAWLEGHPEVVALVGSTRIKHPVDEAGMEAKDWLRSIVEAELADQGGIFK